MQIERSLQQLSLTELLFKFDKIEAKEQQKISLELTRRQPTTEDLATAKQQANYLTCIQEKRAKEPLPLYLKVVCLVFPFTLEGKYWDTIADDELARWKKGGYSKKLKEYGKFSFIGMLMYLGLLIGYLLYKLVYH